MNGFGYGYVVYTPERNESRDYKSKTQMLLALSKVKNRVKFIVFKIDQCGYHVIQEWSKV